MWIPPSSNSTFFTQMHRGIFVIFLLFSPINMQIFKSQKCLHSPLSKPAAVVPVSLFVVAVHLPAIVFVNLSRRCATAVGLFPAVGCLMLPPIFAVLLQCSADFDSTKMRWKCLVFVLLWWWFFLEFLTGLAKKISRKNQNNQNIHCARLSFYSLTFHIHNTTFPTNAAFPHPIPEVDRPADWFWNHRALARTVCLAVLDDTRGGRRRTCAENRCLQFLKIS